MLGLEETGINKSTITRKGNDGLVTIRMTRPITGLFVIRPRPMEQQPIDIREFSIGNTIHNTGSLITLNLIDCPVLGFSEDTLDFVKA